jgi:hypothetical protein
MTEPEAFRSRVGAALGRMPAYRVEVELCEPCWWLAWLPYSQWPGPGRTFSACLSCAPGRLSTPTAELTDCFREHRPLLQMESWRQRKHPRGESAPWVRVLFAPTAELHSPDKCRSCRESTLSGVCPERSGGTRPLGSALDRELSRRKDAWCGRLARLALAARPPGCVTARTALRAGCGSSEIPLAMPGAAALN